MWTRVGHARLQGGRLALELLRAFQTSRGIKRCRSVEDNAGDIHLGALPSCTATRRISPKVFKHSTSKPFKGVYTIGDRGMSKPSRTEVVMHGWSKPKAAVRKDLGDLTQPCCLLKNKGSGQSVTAMRAADPRKGQRHCPHSLPCGEHTSVNIHCHTSLVAFYLSEPTDTESDFCSHCHSVSVPKAA